MFTKPQTKEYHCHSKKNGIDADHQDYSDSANARIHKQDNAEQNRNDAA
jgi:hypothetical protein